MFQALEQRCPCKPVEKTMGKQVVYLQAVKDYAGADIHTAAHGGPHKTACGCALKGAAT